MLVLNMKHTKLNQFRKNIYQITYHFEMASATLDSGVQSLGVWYRLKYVPSRVMC